MQTNAGEEPNVSEETWLAPRVVRHNVRIIRIMLNERHGQTRMSFALLLVMRGRRFEIYGQKT
jgi:hypothetical protein